jgi:hypothetical protein
MPRDEVVEAAVLTLGQCRRLVQAPRLTARARELVLRGLGLVEEILLLLDDEKAAGHEHGG